MNGRPVTRVARGGRRWSAVGLLVLLIGTGARGDESLLLTPQGSEGFRQRARILLEVEGSLKMNLDGQRVREIPLSVRGDLQYDEEYLALAEGRAQPVRAARYYHRAEATLEVRGQTNRPELREDRRMVVASLENGSTVRIYAPAGPLKREELDLFRVPGNSLVIPALFPGRRLATGEAWTVSDTAVAGLLDLDAVTSQDVELRVVRVESNRAVIEGSGQVEGAVGGAATEIGLAAKLNFDLESRRITWLAMAIREKRGIGHAQPGLDVTARVRMTLEPLDASEELEEAVALAREVEETGLDRIVEHQGPGFHMLMDRRWEMLTQRRDVTVFRLVDRGELIAQMNVSMLPPSENGVLLPLEGFQRDIRRSLGDDFDQFVTAGDRSTPHGLRLLQATAAGRPSELPVHWIYYHFSDAQGRRASMAITMEAELVERFEAADATCVDSFRFTVTDEQRQAQDRDGAPTLRR